LLLKSPGPRTQAGFHFSGERLQRKKPANLAACGLKSNSRELEETGEILPVGNLDVSFILVISDINHRDNSQTVKSPLGGSRAKRAFCLLRPEVDFF
jgi:hypothetical protein